MVWASSLDEVVFLHLLKYSGASFPFSLHIQKEAPPLGEGAPALFTWLGRDGVEFPSFLGLADPAWHLAPGPDGGAVGASWLRRSFLRDCWVPSGKHHWVS